MITTPQLANYAPNWDNDQILSLSGRWHIKDTSSFAYGVYAHSTCQRRSPAPQRRALCGIYGYIREYVPKASRRLQAITQGVKQAPVCKNCLAVHAARTAP